MNTIKEIKLDQTSWLELTIENGNNEIIHCESFSGHREHIALLRSRAIEFDVSLDEFEDVIKSCEDAFIYQTDEEIEAEARKQFEIQFRYDRDILLKQVDIEINKAEDAGQDSSLLRVYRQALRDATISWIMPERNF